MTTEEAIRQILTPATHDKLKHLSDERLLVDAAIMAFVGGMSGEAVDVVRQEIKRDYRHIMRRTQRT